MDLIRPMQVRIWLCGGRAQHKENNGCPSSRCLEATQLRFPCLSLVPLNCCPSAGAQGECLRASLCAGPLRKHLGFQLPSFSPSQLESPLIFTVGFCGDSSPRHWNPGLGSSVWGWNTLLPWRGPLQLRYPSQFSTTTHRCRANSFCISAPPISLYAASFLHFLSFRRYIQLVFRWFL